MKKIALGYLLAILTFIFLIIIYSLLNLVFGGLHTILYSAKNSSDEKYTAIAYTEMGGGAAGSCYTYVSVVPRDTFEKYKMGQYEVAGGSCTEDITINWNKNILIINKLHNMFDQDSTNSDGKVKVNYKFDY